MKEEDLSPLILIESPQAALQNTLALFVDLGGPLDTARIEKNFSLAVALYRGEYQGFRACTTEYHNLFHAVQTFVTLGRLLHGALLENEDFSPENISLVLCAAIFHDAGYLQEESDRTGSGAKYALCHVQRGVALLRHIGAECGHTAADLDALESLLLATDLARSMASIPFPSVEVEALGRLLDLADLLAQMADRSYLEKLLFLYYEFREAGLRNYASEADLLRKTIGFYDLIEQRLQPVAEHGDRYLRAHYRQQRQRDINPYRESLLRQRNYLTQILQQAEDEPEAHLRRDGIVAQVKRLHKSP